MYLLGLIKLSVAGEDAICSLEEGKLSGGISSAADMFKSNGRQILLCGALKLLHRPGGVAAVKKVKVDRCKTE